MSLPDKELVDIMSVGVDGMVESGPVVSRLLLSSSLHS